MKITIDKYRELSDIFLRETRQFSGMDWQNWTSGGWRVCSNGFLNIVLEALDIETESTQEEISRINASVCPHCNGTGFISSKIGNLICDCTFKKN